MNFINVALEARILTFRIGLANKAMPSEKVNDKALLN